MQQDDWWYLITSRLFLQQLQGVFGAVCLLQKQGTGKYQLRVVRVAFLHLAEAGQQGVAGLGVGLGGRQREKIKMGFAMQVQRALHHVHGLLMSAGTGQVNGGRAQGFRILRSDLDPELGQFVGGLLIAQKLCNADGTLGHPGITGAACLFQIVVECDIEAVALARDFGGQQIKQSVLAELAVDRWLRLACRLRLLGRAVGRRAGLIQCAAATEQQACEQQCWQGRNECSLHIGSRAKRWADPGGGRRPARHWGIMTQAWGQTQWAP